MNTTLTMTRSQGLHGDEVDFENTWATIESAFREIHTKNASKLSYEELYRHAYRIVLKKKGENLYDKVHEFERSWLSSEVRAGIQQLLSPNLLVNAQSVGGTTANERRVAGEKFLKGLRQAWGDHQVCTSMVADVLMYMVRSILPTMSQTEELLLTRTGLRIVFTVRTIGGLRSSTLPWSSSATKSSNPASPRTIPEHFSAS
jgi:hypothetical protein